MRSATVILSALSVALLSSAAPFNETLLERETPASTCYTQNQYTQLVGDGNPHRDDWHEQISNALTCSQEPDCTSGYSSATTIGWSFDAGFDVGAPGFTDGEGSVGASLGFSVSESVTTTTTENCPGDAGASTCVWTLVPHAAYTVVNVVEDSCGTASTSTPYVMRAPSDPQYYCVEYTCRNINDGYWVYDV